MRFNQQQAAASANSLPVWRKHIPSHIRWLTFCHHGVGISASLRGQRPSLKLPITSPHVSVSHSCFPYGAGNSWRLRDPAWRQSSMECSLFHDGAGVVYWVAYTDSMREDQVRPKNITRTACRIRVNGCVTAATDLFMFRLHRMAPLCRLAVTGKLYHGQEARSTGYERGGRTTYNMARKVCKDNKRGLSKGTSMRSSVI